MFNIFKRKTIEPRIGMRLKRKGGTVIELSKVSVRKDRVHFKFIKMDGKDYNKTTVFDADWKVLLKDYNPV